MADPVEDDGLQTEIHTRELMLQDLLEVRSRARPTPQRVETTETLTVQDIWDVQRACATTAKPARSTHAPRIRDRPEPHNPRTTWQAPVDSTDSLTICDLLEVREREKELRPRQGVQRLGRLPGRRQPPRESSQRTPNGGPEDARYARYLSQLTPAAEIGPSGALWALVLVWSLALAVVLSTPSGQQGVTTLREEIVSGGRSVYAPLRRVSDWLEDGSAGAWRIAEDLIHAARERAGMPSELERVPSLSEQTPGAEQLRVGSQEDSWQEADACLPEAREASGEAQED